MARSPGVRSCAVAAAALLLLTDSSSSSSFRTMQASAFVPTSPTRTVPSRLFIKVDGRTVQGDIDVFQPTNNFLLIRKIGSVEATEGGLFLTGRAKERRDDGVVVAVGPGKTHEETGTYFPMPVEVSDIVSYQKGSGTELTIDGEKHLLITDDDILVRYRTDEQTIETAEMIRDNVLVEVPETKDDVVPSSGILLAKSSKKAKKPSVGTVVKVGPGRQATYGKMMPMEVQVGDMIKFRDFTGLTVQIDNKDYVVVQMASIYAKF